MKTALLIAACIIACKTGSAQDSLANHYKIYDCREKKEITFQQLAQNLPGFDVLFFGEMHNDSVAHYVENELYKRLVKQYGKVVLSMEAFSTDHQTALNEYLAGTIDEATFMQKADAWWPFYHGYRPLLSSAKNFRLPVIAANAPDKFVGLVHDNGMQALDALDAASKKLLPPLPINVKRGKDYEGYKAGVINGHSQYYTDSLWQSMSLYNATMAYSIFKFTSAHKGFKVLSVNGLFHSYNNLGIIPYLHDLNGALKTIAIGCYYAEGYAHPNWNEYDGLDDFIIITDSSVKKTF